MNLTRHADRRRVEFGLWEEDVAEILDDPEVTYGPGSNYTARPDQRLYSRGSWSIVVASDGETVITVLPRRSDNWTHNLEKK